MGTKIKLTKQEINWIERTADIETSRIFQNFQALLKFNPNEKEKELIEKQVIELTELYNFLKTLRYKLELWDCRYDIDTEIEYPDKKEQMEEKRLSENYSHII